MLDKMIFDSDNTLMNPKCANEKRVLLKISGESLGGDLESAIDPKKLEKVAVDLKQLQDDGYEIGIMVGGGNIYRGRDAGNLNRSDADHMGMLGTSINALALQGALRDLGAKVKMLSAISMEQICDTFTQRDAEKLLIDKQIVIFACGIGRPYFSTDTAAALRALEIGAVGLYCAKNIDGIYEADPKKVVGSQRLDQITYDDYIRLNLGAMDQTAVALCRDYSMPIFVFQFDGQNSLVDAIKGEVRGSWVHE